MTFQPSDGPSFGQRHRPVLIGLAAIGVLAAVVLAAALLPKSAPSSSPSPSSIAALPSRSPGSPDSTAPAGGSPAPGDTASPVPSNSPPPSSVPAGPVSYGRDGRLTVLVLGSDWRPNLGGERTDVILVVTIDPQTGRMATASIPRDTVYFPRANAGTSGQLRVNGLYEVYRSTSLAHDKVDPKALKRFTADVAAALKIEIDYYALIRFDGFSELVDKLGGIDVQIKQQIVDDYYRTPSGLRGAYFPVANSWHLTGNPPCKPYPQKCHNSLAYARSRHGTVGTGYNTDFARSRRQQELILDGSHKVVTNGMDALAGLVSAAKGRVYTNLPLTLDAATQLFALADHATLSPDDMQVFSPSKWAFVASRDPAYSFELRMPTVRAWIKAHFKS